MNWTGGILDRSRNANSSLTAKQKAHFAKARGKLDTSRFSVQAFETFGNVPRSAGTNVERAVKQSRGHVAPTGKVKRNSHRTSHRESPQNHGSKRSQWSGHEIPMRRPEQSEYPEHTTKGSPIIISSRNSSVSTFKEDGCIPPRDQIEQGLQKVRENQPSPMPTTADAHRALLLGTSDWIGILHSKPAKVNFTDSYDRSQIGKRRRLSELKDRGNKPKREWYKPRSQISRQDLHALNDFPSQADVSVRIGSMADRQSASDKTKKRWISRLDHAATVSDEMLLDNRFSDRSVISDNPFRKRPPIHEVHHSRPLQNLRLTPSTFRNVTQDLTTNVNNGYTNRFDYGTFSVQGDPDIIGQGMLPLRPSDKRTVEDSTHIPFSFEDVPPLEDRSSEPRTGSRRERKTDIRRMHVSSKRVTTSENQQGPPKIGGLTVQDSTAKPRFFDTSSVARETMDNLEKLDNNSRMLVHLAYQPQGSGPWTTCHEEYASQRTESSEEGVSRSCSPTTHEDAATHNNRQALEDEAEEFERFMEAGALERPPAPKALEPETSLSQKANEHVPGNHATAGSAIRQIKSLQETTDEDEALWRSFVFGKERSNQDWVVELGSEEVAILPQNATSVDPEVHTQPSMEAEIATSRIKQNPHFLEEAMSSSQVARTSGASHIAVVSNTSQANSDEMLDGENQNSDSALRDSPGLHISQSRAVHSNEASSNIAQASTSPPTTLSARNGNTIPSSLSAQAPTPQLPPQLSSDELSWSPSRLSQSVASKPIVLFRKPTRYVGVRSSDPVEPVRFGGAARAGRMSKRKGQGKDEGIWEIGAEQEDLLEDEIEDE